jgi:DNA-binding transcriptional LysR family regulator
MNRNHLALFHCVAQAGGISQGAERARVSQPAVSKQIKELEESLGVKLLERGARGSQLTDAGRLLADYAQRMAVVEQDAEQAIQQFCGLKRGRLALGASTTVGAYVLPGLLRLFHSRHPAVELGLEIANTRDIEALLLEGKVEAGLTEGISESPALTSTVFHRDDLVVIASPEHPLAHKKRVLARDLRAERLILREEGSGTRVVVERALQAAGVEVSPVLSLAGTQAIKQAVAVGLGIAIVSRLTIALEQRFGLLVVVPVQDLVISRPLHLQQLRGRASSPAILEFLKLLKQGGGENWL